MPKMGDGMEEGTINRWLKHEGDSVAVGEVIAEIETDKASVEITAYDAGIITKIVVPEGGSVPVGEVIAIIGGPTASNGAIPTAKPAAPSTPPTSQEKVAKPAADAPVVEFSAGSESERVKASPLARRIAHERGIDLARVHGTGPGGRVVERDVIAFQPAAVSSPLPLVVPQLTAAGTLGKGEGKADPPPAAGALGKGEGDVEIKPSRMREAIARRVVLSKQTVPHFYVTMVVGMDKAAALLKELNADAADGKITVNDLIVKACSAALAKVPAVNATWTPEGTIKRFAEAHIGVAVGIDEGLIIPVIRNCESKTLRQISREARELIGRARVNQLKPEEYSGGTFSVSNLGMMGIDEFSAIINPPEAAILAIGGMVREPVVADGSDEITIRTNMKITISADHRLLDGVIAAHFVQEVKKALEAPYTLLA
jgi:pyruvate dehydrogenase E2 component (dihydrolipoamide acetyltransferase)